MNNIVHQVMDREINWDMICQWMAVWALSNCSFPVIAEGLSGRKSIPAWFDDVCFALAHCFWFLGFQKRYVCLYLVPEDVACHVTPFKISLVWPLHWIHLEPRFWYVLVLCILNYFSVIWLSMEAIACACMFFCGSSLTKLLMTCLQADIQFWNKNKSMEGLSARSVVINFACQFIVFLYLLDNETSWMIIVSAGLGCCIEFWKIGKAMHIEVTS